MTIDTYIAGPMRNVKFFNFPMFDAARNLINSWADHKAVSPADIDREYGFDPKTLPPNYNWDQIPEQAGSKMDIINRDLEELLNCQAIYLLPGWETSKGATAELAIAQWAGHHVYCHSGAKNPDLPENQPKYTAPEVAAVKDSGTVEMRSFASGATRNTDTSKLDYEGFLSPVALESFAKYMHSHRIQADGNMRASDNWQKGIPMDVYMKSMWRHFFDVWKLHRGLPAHSPEDNHALTLEEALNAMLFNVQGYLHEVLKQE